MDCRSLALVLLGSLIANVHSMVSLEISKNTTAPSFTDIKLNCVANGTVSTGFLTWTHYFKDELKKIASSSKYEISESANSTTLISTSTLKIKNLTHSDEGMYICSVGDPTNTGISKAVDVKVVFPVKNVTFTLSNSKGEAYDNGTAPDYRIAPGTYKFSCYGHGSYPAAEISINTTSQQIMVTDNKTRNDSRVVMAAPVFTSYVEGKFSVGSSEAKQELLCSAASLGGVYPTLNATLRLNVVMPNISCEPVRPEHKAGDANVTLSCRVWADVEVQCNEVSWSVKREAKEEYFFVNTGKPDNALGRLSVKCAETNRTSLHTTFELVQLNDSSLSSTYSVVYAGEMFPKQNPMAFGRQMSSTASPRKYHACRFYNTSVLLLIGALSAFVLCSLRF